VSDIEVLDREAGLAWGGDNATSIRTINKELSAPSFRVDCGRRPPNIAAMALIRKLFWLALFLVSTFGFVVLFEHGTTDFVKNAKIEFEGVKKICLTKLERKKDESDKAAR
jgi:hypothetical protein